MNVPPSVAEAAHFYESGLMLSGLENPVHILMLLGVLLLLFGAKRVPELGRSLGTGLREFKLSVTGTTSEAPSDAEAVNERLATRG